MKLLIEIELGNDAMQAAAHASVAITSALQRQASSLFDPLGEDECGAIRDTNGNTVGKWEVVA